MIIIGCDYHPGFQQIAYVDTETGELQERALQHREEAEKFYREGKISQARDAVKKMPSQPRFNRPLMEAVVGLRSQQELDRISIEVANTQSEKGDPETLYQEGSILAFAGKEDAAIRLLRMAIEGNYYAYNPLMKDPLLAKLHTAPEYKKLLDAARSCQEPILALRTSSEN